MSLWSTVFHACHDVKDAWTMLGKPSARALPHHSTIHAWDEALTKRTREWVSSGASETNVVTPRTRTEVAISGVWDRHGEALRQAVAELARALALEMASRHGEECDGEGCSATTTGVPVGVLALAFPETHKRVEWMERMRSGPVYTWEWPHLMRMAHTYASPSTRTAHDRVVQLYTEALVHVLALAFDHH
jgi:hypothetical protein